MRHRVTHITWDVPSSMQNTMPKEVFIDLAFDYDGQTVTLEQHESVEDKVRAALDLTLPLLHWQIDRYPVPYELGRMVGDAVSKGRLVMDERAVTTMIAATGMAIEHGCFDTFFKAMERLCKPHPDNDIVYLGGDGPPEQYSFGVLWYEGKPKWEGSEYVERSGNGDGHMKGAFMVGGLIYRGPAVDARYTDHSWSVHT